MMEINLTNTSINKCAYIPNTCFFVNLLYNCNCPILKNQNALVGFTVNIFPELIFIKWIRTGLIFLPLRAIYRTLFS